MDFHSHSHSLLIILIFIVSLVYITRFHPLLYSGVEYFHSMSKHKLLPMSNSEPTYKPDGWNNSDLIDTQNCYLYAFNDPRIGVKKKPHPGFTKNISSKKKDFTCSFMEQHIKIDYPDTYSVGKNTPCKDGYSKVYTVVDTHNDFHFYRQDSDGSWSHKLGGGDVTNKDASGNTIHDPSVADRKYKVYNYTDPCMFSCVKR